MVHTASGFAKANRRLATLACASSIGPGSTNMVTGAATATVNRLPVLLFPSDYYATRHQGPVLQQLEHPLSADVSVNDCFRPVSRYFDRITRPEQLLTALPEAMRVLTDPAETGAVTLALCQDIQAHAYDYPLRFFQERTWSIERRLPPVERTAQAVDMILAAERPMIIAGGGVIYSEAEAELMAVAQKFGIPVGETMAGKGAMVDDSALTLGGYGVTGTGSAGRLMHQADLVIAVGTRLSDFATGSQSAFHNPDVRFISINVSGHDAYKLGALPIVADAREALSALLIAGEAAGILPNPAWLEEVAVAKQEWQEHLAIDVFVQHEGEAISSGADAARDQRAGCGGRHDRRRGRRAARRPAPTLGYDRQTPRSPGVRLLLHGLRDTGGVGRAYDAAGGRGLRNGRRRHLYDAAVRDCDVDPGGIEDHGADHG